MNNATHNTVKELDAIFDAIEAIDGIARAMLSGSEDHIPLAKGIQHIASDMLERVDSYRTQMVETVADPS